MTTTESEVRVVWRSESAVSAAVRDPTGGGVVDVRWSAVGGWGCSCGDPACVHQDAVRQTVGEVA